MQALGKPVVPEVYWRFARVWPVISTASRSAGYAASSAGEEASTTRRSASSPFAMRTSSTRPACSASVNSTRAPESWRTNSRSARWYDEFTGTVTAPALRIASQATGHCTTLGSMIATRSPGRTPSSVASRRASREVQSSISAKVHDPSVNRRNSRSGDVAAWVASRSTRVPIGGSSAMRSRAMAQSRGTDSIPVMVNLFTLVGCDAGAAHDRVVTAYPR